MNPPFESCSWLSRRSPAASGQPGLRPLETRAEGPQNRGLRGQLEQLQGLVRCLFACVVLQLQQRQSCVGCQYLHIWVAFFLFFFLEGEAGTLPLQNQNLKSGFSERFRGF